MANSGEAVGAPERVVSATAMPWAQRRFAQGEGFEVARNGALYFVGSDDDTRHFTLVQQWPALLERRRR